MVGFRILSRRPGFRRAGIAHPAVKDYAPGELTDAQLDAIRAEPNLTIVEYTPESEAAPADGTLPSAGGGEDSLLLVIRACGVPEPHLIGLVASGMIIRAKMVDDGEIGPAEFCRDLIQFAERRLSQIAETTIPAPQQPAEPAGLTAEPGAEPVDDSDGDAAQATAHEAPSLTEPAPETGEATGSGSAAAAPVADLVSHGEQATPVVSHETADVNANAPAKPAKVARKGK